MIKKTENQYQARVQANQQNQIKLDLIREIVYCSHLVGAKDSQ